MTAQTHLPPQWRERLLAMLNVRGWQDRMPAEPMRLLAAWQRAEGGSARWNPLNTTYYVVGATNYNDAKVKNYRRATDGVCATALTLVNGFYNGILGELQSGLLEAEQVVDMHRAQFQKWGTNPDTILRVLREL